MREENTTIHLNTSTFLPTFLLAYIIFKHYKIEHNMNIRPISFYIFNYFNEPSKSFFNRIFLPSIKRPKTSKNAIGSKVDRNKKRFKMNAI